MNTNEFYVARNFSMLEQAQSLMSNLVTVETSGLDHDDVQKVKKAILDLQFKTNDVVNQLKAERS